MREPPPLACLTSAAYARAVRDGATRCRPRAPRGRARTAIPQRGPTTPSTCSCSAGGSRSRSCWSSARGADEQGPGGTPTSRAASAAGRGGCGMGCCSRGDRAPMTEPFDVCGPLPRGVDGARGERGHRQDVHDRRAGRALRRRGRAARAAAAGHLHADGDRRAARARPRAARERRAGAQPGAGRRARAGRRPLVACSRPRTSERRRDNLALALADFDAATIATIHGFCQEVLGGLGVGADVGPDEFVEDVTDLREEVVDDLYVRRFLRDDRPTLDRAREAGDDRADRRREPGHAARAARRAGGSWPPCASGSPRPSATSSRCARRAPASSPTTTC